MGDLSKAGQPALITMINESLRVLLGSDEERMRKSIVEEVSRKLSNTPMGLADFTVGIEPTVKELTDLLDLKSGGVRVLGLHGMGGIGKTTLAKALFNTLVAHGFSLRSFISNIRETWPQEDGPESLRNRLLIDLSKDHSNDDDNDVDRIRRALVVLDDVDDVKQLDALIVAERKRFRDGSRIIVTTRDRETLPGHIVNVEYEVRELDSDKSLRLFSYHALRREKPTDCLLSLSNQIVELTGGLPLALEVFGSFLFSKRRVEEWRDALEKLKKIRPKDLQEVMKISYNALDEESQCVFLDISCHFVSKETERDYAIDVFRGCGFNGETAVSDLTAKSLVKIREDGKIWMHDQVRDMGRQIVKQESIVDPRQRSRLWNRDEIAAVFLDDKRKKCTQGISLDLKEKLRVKDLCGAMIARHKLVTSPNLSNLLNYAKESWKQYKENQVEKKKEFVIVPKSLETMESLRLLQLNYANLEGDFKFPVELKWLQWKGCPLKYFPSCVHARGLSFLDLSESKIERLWDSNGDKVGENLMVLDLSDCHLLTALPNLSSNQRLEKLFLNRCFRLARIDESLGNVKTLVHLDLQRCTSLTEIPSDVSGWKLLKTLNVSGCSKLKELPKNIETMKSLKRLLIDDTAIESLPESIYLLTQLESLSLDRCMLLKQLPKCIGKLCSLKELSLSGSGLEELPSSIDSLANLEDLNLSWCSSLSQLPESIGNLKMLNEFSIFGTKIKEVPDCVGFLQNLKTLIMGRGNFIHTLPSSLGGLKYLIMLSINDTLITDLPDDMGGLKSLKTLELRQCKSLKSIPESIGSCLSLTHLTIYGAKIKDLPESIGNLESLTMLTLNSCREFLKLPDSMGRLKSLTFLLMKETAVEELPKSFGALSSLIEFHVSKTPNVEDSARGGQFFPASFSNLSALRELDARARKMTGEIPDDFEKLESLETLKLGYNCFSRFPASLRGLSYLKELNLRDCRELKSLPPLPSSLTSIDVSNCVSLEVLSDLSNLEMLEELNVSNCEKVEDIPGLERLKSLRRLFMTSCDACSLKTKSRLAKASLRKIRNLTMPGSKIPDWFTQDVVTFKERRNRPIKGMIIGIVFSFDNQIQDLMKDKLWRITDIKANIFKQDMQIHGTAFNLGSLPNKNADQVHFSRYTADWPLVSMLKDGYKIVIDMKNPPSLKGVELKKWGVHLVYEGEDDYDGDEKLLNNSQQSVSQKWAEFFST